MVRDLSNSNDSPLLFFVWIRYGRWQHETNLSRFDGRKQQFGAGTGHVNIHIFTPLAKTTHRLTSPDLRYAQDCRCPQGVDMLHTPNTPASGSAGHRYPGKVLYFFRIVTGKNRDIS